MTSKPSQELKYLSKRFKIFDFIITCNKLLI